MIIFRKSGELTIYIEEQRKIGRKIGFVPTMGALHEGHLSLIATARKANELVVCSIFVNPTQFTNPEDLRLYPVMLENDIRELTTATCDVLFLPSVPEIYPPSHQKKVYLIGSLEHLHEGKYRPGHFQGVAEVMDRLLSLVRPHNLYMGQKDFQQCMVVGKLILLLHMENEIKLTVVPTAREEDGLAMSSRNLRLGKNERIKAKSIYRELKYIRDHYPYSNVEELERNARTNLENEGFLVDYITVVNANNLEPSAKGQQVVLAAATIGGIRLIDNLLLN